MAILGILTGGSPVKAKKERGAGIKKYNGKLFALKLL